MRVTFKVKRWLLVLSFHVMVVNKTLSHTHKRELIPPESMWSAHVFTLAFPLSLSLSICVSHSCSVNVQSRWPCSTNIMITMATTLSERNLLCPEHSSSNQSEIVTGADKKKRGGGSSRWRQKEVERNVYWKLILGKGGCCMTMCVITH